MVCVCAWESDCVALCCGLCLGSEQCFLFSLLPKMGVYYASGLNRNFMYLNYGQETVPNGLVRTAYVYG